jgi:hypothetical protein
MVLLQTDQGRSYHVRRCIRVEDNGDLPTDTCQHSSTLEVPRGQERPSLRHVLGLGDAKEGVITVVVNEGFEKASLDEEVRMYANRVLIKRGKR